MYIHVYFYMHINLNNTTFYIYNLFMNILEKMQVKWYSLSISIIYKYKLSQLQVIHI